MLRRAQGGDDAAIAELLRSIRPYLTKVASGYVDASVASRSASDLVQEAEMRVWRSLEQFNGDAPSDEDAFAMFRTWLVQIVRRLGRDIHRDRNAQKRRPRGRRLVPLDEPKRAADGAAQTSAGRMRRDVTDTGTTASARMMAQERADLVRQTIDDLLDESERAIVQSYFFDGESLRQIAERIGIPYHTVKDLYRKSMSRLERVLGEL